MSRFPSSSLLPVLALVLVSGLSACSPGEDQEESQREETPQETAPPEALIAADAEPAEILAALEERLLAGGELAYEIESSGAFTSDLKGELRFAEKGVVHLSMAGSFGPSRFEGRTVAIADDQIRIDASEVKGVGERAAEAYADGLVRMGLLHNLARLTMGMGPDWADREVDEAVQLEAFEDLGEHEREGETVRRLRFAIHVAQVPGPDSEKLQRGQGTLDLEVLSGLPVRRTQTVQFGAQTMEVVERYRPVRADG